MVTHITTGDDRRQTLAGTLIACLHYQTDDGGLNTDAVIP